MNAGMKVDMKERSNKVHNIDIVFNGLGETTVVQMLDVQEIACGE